MSDTLLFLIIAAIGLWFGLGLQRTRPPQVVVVQVDAEPPAANGCLVIGLFALALFILLVLAAG